MVHGYKELRPKYRIRSTAGADASVEVDLATKFGAMIVAKKDTVIDVITAPEKINSTSKGRIF